MTNPYEAPRADLDPLVDSSYYQDKNIADLFVIGIPKMVALHVLSLGLFPAYWFYKQWRTYARARRLKISSWLRAFVPVLWVVQLFIAIDKEARRVGKRPSWSPMLQATIYLALSAAGALLRRPGLAGWIVAVFIWMVSLIPLISAQRVSNVVAGDPLGQSNARFTFSNFMALLPIWLIWGSIIVSAYFAYTHKLPL